MAERTCTELVLTWYMNNPERRSGKLADNALFRMLYNAFCRANGSTRTFADVVKEASYTEACDRLYAWYRERYKTGFHMPTGSKGQKRTVTGNGGKYTFDLLYGDDRQFRSYLVTDIPHSGSQDLFSFVLHTAVAFLVPPGELDMVLQYLGFHPLHVKNIHHLAIYYVLLAAENRPLAEDFNPFAQVRSLYEKGIAIMEDPEDKPAGGFLYGNRETRFIRQALFLEKELRSQSFENLVSVNKAALNTRHSLILSDFHKLAAVFMYIYDVNSDDIDNNYAQNVEEAFSFYAFVEAFCRDNLSRKKYREQLTGMIDLHGKHPTRNIMILLWLYAFCFSFTQSVYLDGIVFQRITKKLAGYDPAWAEEAKEYYREELFDVFGFLTGAAGRTVPAAFRGSEFVAFINEKLWQRYGWGPLNARIPFDYYILKLGELVICKDQRYSAALPPLVTHSQDRITDVRPRVVNVPDPLAAVVYILSQLKGVIEERYERIGLVDQSPCPLKCGLYEQV